MTKKIKPTFDNVIVHMTPPAKTRTGIIITKEDKNEIERGIVTHKGPLVTKVVKGDIILFEKYNIEPIKIGKETLNFVKESDIIGMYGETKKRT